MVVVGLLQLKCRKNLCYNLPSQKKIALRHSTADPNVMGFSCKARAAAVNLLKTQELLEHVAQQNP